MPTGTKSAFVVGQLGVHERVDRVPDRHHEESAAVGWRLGRHVGADHAAGAGPVVDHDGLAVAGGRGQLLADQARVHVRRAPRWEGHHDLDGAVRPGTFGGMHFGQGRQGGDGEEGAHQKAAGGRCGPEEGGTVHGGLQQSESTGGACTPFSNR